MHWNCLFLSLFVCVFFLIATLLTNGDVYYGIILHRKLDVWLCVAAAGARSFVVDDTYIYLVDKRKQRKQTILSMILTHVQESLG